MYFGTWVQLPVRTASANILRVSREIFVPVFIRQRRGGIRRRISGHTVQSELTTASLNKS